jgi:hypothetical protein
MQLANAILLCTVLAPQVSTPQSPALGSEAPKIHGETLNGKPINLPEAAAGKLTILVLGFSRQGGQKTGLWAKHLSADFATDPLFTSYTVAMLEDAPAMLRGMIRSGIRSGTPVSERDHVVTTASGEAAWKEFLHAAQKDVPYLVLLDSGGKVRWTGHGAFEQQQYEALRTAVKTEEYRHGSEPRG